MLDEIVLTSSWQLVGRNVVSTFLLLTALYVGIALASTLSEEGFTLPAMLGSLPAIGRLLLFVLPVQVSFFLLYVAGCYVEIRCTPHAIHFYKPFALFSRHQVQLMTGLQQVTIASFKSKGFVFTRAGYKAERVEFDFLPDASLAQFAAFLQRHAVAIANF